MLRFDGLKNPQRRKDLEDGNGVTLFGEEGENALSMVPDWGEYRKTSATYAFRMEEEFEVDTLEGLHRGKAGDYLAMGQAGELYPIDAAVFAATYERAD